MLYSVIDVTEPWTAADRWSVACWHVAWCTMVHVLFLGRFAWSGIREWTPRLRLVELGREGVEREGEVFHVMTCHLLKLTCFLLNILFKTWKIWGLPRYSLQMWEYIFGWSHHIDAGCIAESKDLCFEDWDSQDVALSAVSLKYTWRHPVKM